MKVLLPLTVINLFCAAVYLWLTDPKLPNGISADLQRFGLVMQISLAAVGVFVLLALVGLG